LLTERPSYPWSVGELAQSVHLSVRALQQAFSRSVGMSPMSYLRQVRLTQAHRELSNGSPEEFTVREVAERWGFVHHGRFAAAYRSRFGETPRQTLRGRPD
jgi:AraC-like DNA-binding protein